MQPAGVKLAVTLTLFVLAESSKVSTSKCLYFTATPLLVQFSRLVSQRLLIAPPQVALARLGPLVTTSQIVLELSLEMKPVKVPGNGPLEKVTPLPLL